MSLSAIERTSKALDLIPYIVEHPAISIEELAEIFSVPSAEMVELLNIVFMCGLPGYSHLELIDISTEDGFVSVIDAQNLDKPRKLTQVEIISIVLGLQNLKTQGVKPAVMVIIEDLERKMLALLGDIETLSLVDNSQTVEQSPWKALIDECLNENATIEIEYVGLASEKLTHRLIAPKRLYINSGHYYLTAFCSTAQAERNFRLDRIQSAVKSAEVLLHSFSTVADVDEEVQILIPKGALQFIELHNEIVETSQQLGDQLHLTLSISNTAWLLRTLSAINGSVSILSPENLSRDFELLNQRVLSNYGQI